MKLILVLAIVSGTLIAAPAPAAAQGPCIPKEMRENVEADREASAEELKAARTKFEQAKKLETSAPDKDKEKAKNAARAASEKLRDAEIKAAIVNGLSDRVAKFYSCAQAQPAAPELATAAQTGANSQKAISLPPGLLSELSEIRSSMRAYMQLLLLLVLLIVASIVGLFLYLRTALRRMDEAASERSRQDGGTPPIRTQAPHAPEPVRPPATPSKPSSPTQRVQTGALGSDLPQQPINRQVPPRQPSTSPSTGSIGAGRPQVVGGMVDPYRPAGQPQLFPPPQAPTPLVSNGNGPDTDTWRKRIQPSAVSGFEDFDEQLSEAEIWPILLPMAANLVETVPNLDSASLTRELLLSIERSSPSLAKNLRRIGFQLISGRLAPNGKEVSRNPEMFAIELPGRTLLFPSPRSRYKQAFDTFFEGATTENWRECIQPARVQKTADNLLEVVERGISGR